MIETPGRPTGGPGRSTPWIILAISLLTTVGVTLFASSTIDERESLRFAQETKRITLAVEQRMSAYGASLLAGSNLFRAERTVDPERIVRFFERQSIDTAFQGVQGVGYAVYVPIASVDSLERAIAPAYRSYGIDYRVFPETEEQFRTPIVMIAPLDDRNRAAVGYDMYSEIVRRTAIEAARDKGVPQLTGIVRLKQEIDADVQAGFLLYAPTYADGEIPQTVDERRATFSGTFYSPFRAGDLFDAISKDYSSGGIDFDVFDGTTPADSTLLYRHRNSLRSGSASFEETVSLDVHGRVWTLRYRATDEFGEGSDRNLLLVTLGVGIIFSIILFVLTRSQIRAYDRLASTTEELQSAREELAAVNRSLERRVEERTSDLERANEELKTFAYTVSHDLRSPLRAIDGFSKFLQEDHGKNLDESGREYLTRIRAGAHRMGEIIDDLLVLSRVTRAEIDLGHVDLTSLCRAIAADLSRSDPERNVVVDIENDLTVVADGRLVQIALENLIGNAWKFTGKEIEGSIAVRRVEAVPPGQTTPIEVIEIADNGVGFDPEYSGLLFDTFRRLHSPADFPGTGIGLATVKRIVERLDGVVWATAVQDRGARFFVRFQPAEDRSVES